jgi:hypothetical protein
MYVCVCVYLYATVKGTVHALYEKNTVCIPYSESIPETFKHTHALCTHTPYAYAHAHGAHTHTHTHLFTHIYKFTDTKHIG